MSKDWASQRPTLWNAIASELVASDLGRLDCAYIYMRQNGNGHKPKSKDDAADDDDDNESEKSIGIKRCYNGDNESEKLLAIKRCYNDDDESDKSLANIAHFAFFSPCYRSCYLNTCRRAIKR